MKISQSPLILLASGSFLLCQLSGQEQELINALTKVDSKGTGNEQAVQAWPAVKKLNASSIPKLLEAMNQANDLGDNWIRSAISELMDREGSGFPEDRILSFLKNDGNTGSSRKLAFEIIREKKPGLAKDLTPKFIDDREPSLRRLAVGDLLDPKGDITKTVKDAMKATPGQAQSSSSAHPEGKKEDKKKRTSSGQAAKTAGAKKLKAGQ